MSSSVRTSALGSNARLNMRPDSVIAGDVNSAKGSSPSSDIITQDQRKNEVPSSLTQGKGPAYQQSETSSEQTVPQQTLAVNPLMLSRATPPAPCAEAQRG